MLTTRSFLLSFFTGIVLIRFLLCIPWWHTSLQHFFEGASAAPQSGFKCLKEANLTQKSKLSNVNSLKMHLHYIGHLISDHGIQLLPEKVSATEKLKEPSNIDELHHCLGLTGYYRKFIPLFADVTKPLNKLLRKGIKFH